MVLPSTMPKSNSAGVLLRGLRAISDFEVELQMAHTNKTISTQIETVFLATSNEYSFLSSSVVKEIARFGGSVDHLVPPHIALDIYKCYNHNSPTANPMTTETISPLKSMPMRSPGNLQRKCRYSGGTQPPGGINSF